MMLAELAWPEVLECTARDPSSFVSLCSWQTAPFASQHRSGCVAARATQQVPQSVAPAKQNNLGQGQSHAHARTVSASAGLGQVRAV